MSPLDTVLSRLPEARRAGGQHLTRCPCHEDRRPSLGIRELDDGKVLLRCYAGCPTPEVIAALGLRWSDLFPR